MQMSEISPLREEINMLNPDLINEQELDSEMENLQDETEISDIHN